MFLFYILAFFALFPILDYKPWDPSYTIVAYIIFPTLHYLFLEALQNIRDNAAKTVISDKYSDFPFEVEKRINGILIDHGLYKYSNVKTKSEEAFFTLYENYKVKVKKNPLFCPKCKCLTLVKKGEDENKNQVFRCLSCKHRERRGFRRKTLVEWIADQKAQGISAAELRDTMSSLHPFVRMKIDFSNSELLGKCPRCKHGVFQYKDKYICEKSIGEKQDCSFQLNTEVLGQKITLEQIKKLLVKGETDTLPGFITAKSNKRFEARIQLNNDGSIKFADITTRS